MRGPGGQEPRDGERRGSTIGRPESGCPGGTTSVAAAQVASAPTGSPASTTAIAGGAPPSWCARDAASRARCARFRAAASCRASDGLFSSACHDSTFCDKRAASIFQPSVDGPPSAGLVGPHGFGPSPSRQFTVTGSVTGTSSRSKPRSHPDFQCESLGGCAV